jgi:hypothetical protein
MIACTLGKQKILSRIERERNFVVFYKMKDTKCCWEQNSEGKPKFIYIYIAPGIRIMKNK